MGKDKGDNQKRQSDIIKELSKGRGGKSDAELKQLTDEYNELQNKGSSEEE